jgi:uncharacterized protein YdeI (BOF family)
MTSVSIPASSGMTTAAAALVLAAAVALAGCGTGYSRVRDIKAAPDSFVNKEVRLQGTAARTSEPGRANAYLLRDGSGEITVMTKGALPAQDAEVAVRGIVRSVVSRGVGWSLELRVEETERLR